MIEANKEPDSQAIDYFSSRHPLRRLITRVAYRARRKMFDRFMSLMLITPETTVLDVGVTPDRELADSNFFEQFYPYKNKITATSIEDASFLEQQYPGLRFIQTTDKTLPFEDKAFDIVFCSAVLEHVGDRESQRRFLAEILRVSKRFFLTTPNRQFPIEVHTFLPLIHWLPQPAHQFILNKIGLKFWAKTENLNLLTPGSLLTLFPAGVELTLTSHRLLGILPSNLIVYGKSKSQS